MKSFDSIKMLSETTKFRESNNEVALAEASVRLSCAHGSLQSYAGGSSSMQGEIEEVTPARNMISLEGVSTAEISDLTFDMAAEISSVNAIRRTNREISKLAVYNLADAFRSALAPVADGTARTVSDESRKLLGFAFDGVAAKICERIKGVGQYPNNFRPMFDQFVDNMIDFTVPVLLLQRESVYSPKITLVEHLEELGAMIEKILDDTAPIYVHLAELPLDQGTPFKFTLNTHASRIAEFGEILPSLNFIDGRMHVHQPEPTTEGVPVFRIIGTDFSAIGDAAMMLTGEQKFSISGTLMPNIFGKPIIFDREDQELGLISPSTWIMKVGGVVVFIPDTLAHTIMRSNEV